MPRHRGRWSIWWNRCEKSDFEADRDDRNCRRLGNVFLDARYASFLKKLGSAGARSRVHETRYARARITGYFLDDRCTVHLAPYTLGLASASTCCRRWMLEERRCYSKFPRSTYSPLSKKELRKWLSFGRRFNLVTSAGLFFTASFMVIPCFYRGEAF